MSKRKHLNLPPSKLFRTPQELIDGYRLFVDGNRNRRVTLIGRPLPSGNVSLMRYSYCGGRKVRERTGAILMPETCQTVKDDNKRILLAQATVCDEINATLIRSDACFVPSKCKRILMSDYIEICKSKMKPSFERSLDSLKRHLGICFPALEVGDADVRQVRKFLAYLRNEAVSLTHKDCKEAPRLKPNTQFGIMSTLSLVLNHALDDNMLGDNPCRKLARGERPKLQDDVRDYLSKDELRRLMRTDYLAKAEFKDVPRAFLFSCFTGLRISDVRRLTAKNIGSDDGGEYILFKVKKTGASQKLYLNDYAKRYLPSPCGSKPLFSLPSSAGLNKNLKKWARAAGVAKRLTFHVARHTCATLMLSARVPLEVVSAQLGHKSIRTTQRYARVTGENQRNGVDQMARYLGE